MTTDRTQELIRKLAAWETGKVARFPGLRQACPNCDGTGRPRFPCARCIGTGWVPAEPSLELAFGVYKTLGIYDLHFHFRDLPVRVWTPDGERNIDAEGADELEAAFALVEKVAEKEKL